jgi:hypothetical protein
MRLVRSSQGHKDRNSRLLEMPRPWITAAQFPTAAWTTLQVAHIPTASTSAKTFFSLERGEETQHTKLRHNILDSYAHESRPYGPALSLMASSIGSQPNAGHEARLNAALMKPGGRFLCGRLSHNDAGRTRQRVLRQHPPAGGL